MHGRGGEERKRTRHMWTTPTRSNPIVSAAPDVSSSPSSSSANSFYKDGRKISVGDCALFKPPQKCPPFIGIIRSLTVGKESKLKLVVNWLYRSAEVNLGKGLLLEAAPNEIFYSFHKDEIPAASLLHPCKVAFLPKGVELPSGISSFVCRRVYDIANQSLWWLTDQDYINELQEEVDQLLSRTRIEMHATVQPGGRSPKPVSSPTSSQLKPSSDGVQNSASSFPSQVKGRKRERVDQGSEPVKRERTIKIEDGDSGHSRQENILKTEIAKITQKGGLVNTEGVEKLVQLMVPDRNVKKIDLSSRSILAAVIAATDKFDCLSQFVQLKGLPVYDEWLQEVHKGKIGDGSGSRDGDKSVEEFLLVLLRALDKLPVNLQALQTCNIGKSVNHLRTHKNSEIQKKARGLVDTWKKRVEAEMNINDAKSGSGQTVPWHTRTRLSEVAQAGNRNFGGSSDVAVKSSVTQLSASKTASVKIAQGENAPRAASPGSMKSVPSPTSAAVNPKDGQPRATGLSGSDVPIANARDEKSSSSSQSHNNSQSCSSDHAKPGGFSGKEDARSSTAMSVNKLSGSSSRHRKSVNGISGSSSCAGQRESGRNSSLHKNTNSEKLSQSGLTEKAHDGTSLEASTPKLIVKIPNRGRSPAESASGGSFDDPSIMNSRASSPVISEKNDQFDHSSKEKIDLYRANIGSDVNTEYWQNNDYKDVLIGSDEGDGSPAAVTDEERFRTADDSKKMVEASKAASSSSGNENKAVTIRDASFSSINALIESVKYSEVNASLSAVDDVGMNLLASVAAGEISKSEPATPTGSPERNTTTDEPSCPGNAIVKASEENHPQLECRMNNEIEDHKKQDNTSGDSCANNNDNDSGFLASEVKVAEEHNRHTTSTVGSQRVTESCLESKENLSEIPVAASLAEFPESAMQEARDSDSSKQFKEKKLVGIVNAGGDLDVKVNGAAREVEMESIEKSLSKPSVEADAKGDNCTIEGLISGGETVPKVSDTVMQSNLVKGTDESVLHPSDNSVDKAAEDLSERESKKTDEVAAQNLASQSEMQKNECKSDGVMITENRSTAGLGSNFNGHAAECVEENSETKEVRDQHAGQVLHKASPSFPSQEMEQRLGSKLSKLNPEEAEDVEECTSTTADASSISAAGVSDVVDAKVEFDLNEGFTADDGKSGEFNSSAMPGCAPAVRLISPVPFPASTMTNGIPSTITVAAPAKGPFVPPEDLLKTKGELGWKGSAATSAFRPAEPRKVVEMSPGTSSVPMSDAAAGKKSRQLLDFDLNVPDERILDDVASQPCSHQTDGVSRSANNCDQVCNKTMASPVRCSGGLGLDLNQVDETSDGVNCTMSNGHKMDVQHLQVKPSSSGHPSREVTALRDFDLNDGPAVDEVNTEPSLVTHHARSIVPSQPPVSGPRTSNTELGSFSSWFPSAGNTYSAVTISSIMPDRGDQPFSIVAPNGPQRMLSHATAGSPFGPDVYRGPVLSSPAVPYPSAPYQYPVFPFNSSFPLPSSSFSGGSTTYVDSASGGRLCFPTVNSQLIGPASTVSSHYPRPCVFSLPDGSGTAENTKKWRGQGLDLNAGPGGPDIEGRDESSSLLPRQLSVASSQALAEEQARMLQLAGGVKRKEPDGGWDGYKQSSWQ